MLKWKKNFLLFVAFCYPMIMLSLAADKPQPETDLNFAESLYVKLSSACRAIVDLRYSPMDNNDELIKTIKVIHVDGNTMKTLPIDKAFVSLVQPSMFDITKQTKVIIHGYKSSSQFEIPLNLAEAYNQKKNFNVFLIDSEELISQWYPLSVHNARLVGKRLANLLANLESIGANAEDFHLLGISLGAHIAGWAGKYFQQYKNRKLGRITGLDPAGPCFTHAYSEQRLDKKDAVYVDVIHSNRLVQGVIEPLGHADFYVNGGGPQQPGCFTPSCSHLRAAQVYTESVLNPKSFVGLKCRSWKDFIEESCKEDKYAVLGYGSPPTTRGLFYLRTNQESPFGLKMEGTKNSKSNLNSWFRALNLT